VLRYALSAPKDVKMTADHVTLMRGLHHQPVKDLEEAIALKREPLPPPKK
jgi:hypothetical protein